MSIKFIFVAVNLLLRVIKHPSIQDRTRLVLTLTKINSCVLYAFPCTTLWMVLLIFLTRGCCQVIFAFAKVCQACFQHVAMCPSPLGLKSPPRSLSSNYIYATNGRGTVYILKFNVQGDYLNPINSNSANSDACLSKNRQLKSISLFHSYVTEDKVYPVSPQAALNHYKHSTHSTKLTV